MNRKEMVIAAVKNINSVDQCDPAFDVAAFALSHALTGQQKDTLAQLVKQGPVDDGDVMSKSSRDDLLEMGLISKAVVKGEQGYQVANYRGWSVHCAQAKLIGA